jgi:hypothetical protein
MASQATTQMLGDFTSMYSNMAQATYNNEMSMLKTRAEAGEDVAAEMERAERKMFESRKKSAVAQAAINTAQGVTAVLADASLPTIARFALAGTALANGLSQVAAIRSSSFGSANVSSNVSSGQADMGQAQQVQRTLVIQGDFDSGMMFSGDNVRQLMDAISEATRDGYQVVVG